IPNVLELDDIYLDLMSYPSTFPIMEKVIGPDIQLIGIQARTYPPAPEAYIRWHRDCPPFDHPQYALKSKLFYYLFDVEENGGCTSFVPDTHRSVEDIPKFDTPEEMPGHIKMTAKAGTAVIFDTRLWHTAMTNTSQSSRICLIYNYAPFWFKQYASTIEQALRLDEKVSDPMDRQLLGLERVSGGNPYVPKVA
ncbi:MAG: phytanoyl-CoA dioxygenase family protein, partial [Candidatus Latescibacteria bacterium]|nr:phytanoyl-CoA dioxygenase family protein [Candidatus Latescibacterota bacterium]